MRNSSSTTSMPSAPGAAARKRNLLDTFQRFMDLEAPKGPGGRRGSASAEGEEHHPSGAISLVPDEAARESVGAKWESLQVTKMTLVVEFLQKGGEKIIAFFKYSFFLFYSNVLIKTLSFSCLSQYFEERRHNLENAVADSSYGSLSSASSSSSTASASNGNSRPNSETASSDKDGKEKERLTARERFLRMKKDGWRRLKSQLFRKRRTYKSGSNVCYGEVSTSPNGIPPVSGVPEITTTPSGLPDPSRIGEKEGGGVLSGIRSSRSMQNLDRITRESYFNLRDATAGWKQRYHSRTELREARHVFFANTN